MRVVLLWKGVTSYVDAEIRALRADGVEVALAVLGASSRQHPQHRSSLDVLPHTMQVDPTTAGADVARWIRSFDPDVVVCCGWDPKPFMSAISLLQDHRCRKVLFMDGQWSGTVKQRAGVVAAHRLLHRRFDAVLLPGEPQARFARRLGFTSSQIHECGYVADVEGFAGARLEPASWLGCPPAFLFCGRLVPEKGVDVLLAAYAKYRATQRSPWSLTVAGTGPLSNLFTSGDGIELAGFVQPDELPQLFARSRALVLPSRFEPWGVVVHEAACAGLPLVLSERVGAGSRFLHHRVNGFRVDVDSIDSLAWALTELSNWTDHEFERSRRRSIELAEQLRLSDFVRAIRALGGS